MTSYFLVFGNTRTGVTPVFLEETTFHCVHDHNGSG